ncbi:PAS domain-containing transcriptional regulator [Azospirillum sp. sgz301742]
MPPIRTPAPSPSGSFEYRLQRTPVGVVMLDLGRRIMAVNAVAGRLLRLKGANPLGADILDFHPPAARAKVRWLIDAAENATDGTAGMVVTTPMGSLVAKVTLLGDQGFCMMFHALGESAMGEGEPAGRPHLLKLPVLRGGATVLVDIAEVVCLTAQGHYAEALTLAGTHLCPLPLAELEKRVDPLTFVRVHRRHLVNLRHVRAAERLDGRWTLALSGDHGPRIPVGRDKVELVRRLLAV